MFPGFRLALPPKRWFKDNYDSDFLEDRQLGLQAFLQNLIAHKDIANWYVTITFHVIASHIFFIVKGLLNNEQLLLNHFNSHAPSNHMQMLLLCYGAKRTRKQSHAHLCLVFASLGVREFLCLDDPPGPFDSLEESRVSMHIQLEAYVMFSSCV